MVQPARNVQHAEPLVCKELHLTRLGNAGKVIQPEPPVEPPAAVTANAATPLPVTARGAAAGLARPGGGGTRVGVGTVGTRRSGRAWPAVARPQA